MNAFSKLFVAATILFSANYASATIPGFPKQPGDLTAEQCTKLRSELDKYVAYVNAWLAAQPARKQRLLKPYVDYAIAQAEKYVDKVCPEAPGNGYSPNSPYECSIFNSDSSALISIGINSSGALVNDGSATKTVCMSQAACANIVSQKFVLFSWVGTARCADPNDTTVQHLTDAEVQTKINAIP